MIKGQVILVGCGKMGMSLLSGFCGKAVAREGITVIEPAAALAEKARSAFGVKVVATLQEILPLAAPLTVIFAVKPQVMGDILSPYREHCPRNTLFLSIAAGKTLAFLEEHLGGKRVVIRSMPNLPATIGKGVTVASANAFVSKEQRAEAEAILASVGEVVWLEEEGLLDAVTAISGSGPAYVFHLLEAWVEAGKALGLPEAIALKLAYATLSGSAAMAEASEYSASELREQVTSPGGTTAAALSVLMDEKNGLKPLFKKATLAACARSKELAE